MVFPKVLPEILENAYNCVVPSSLLLIAKLLIVCLSALCIFVREMSLPIHNKWLWNTFVLFAGHCECIEFRNFFHVIFRTRRPPHKHKHITFKQREENVVSGKFCVSFYEDGTWLGGPFKKISSCTLSLNLNFLL